MRNVNIFPTIPVNQILFIFSERWCYCIWTLDLIC